MSGDPRNVTEPALRELAIRITSQADDRMVQLSSGACTDYAHYREQVGHLNALQNVLLLITEMDAERHGARPGTDAASG